MAKDLETTPTTPSKEVVAIDELYWTYRERLNIPGAYGNLTPINFVNAIDQAPVQ